MHPLLSSPFRAEAVALPTTRRLTAARLWGLALLAAGLLPLLTPTTVRAQDSDDQGWSQFSRENTLRGTVTGEQVTGKGRGSFAVKTDNGDRWTVLYGDNSRFIHDRQPGTPAEIHTGDMLFVAGNVDAKKHFVGAAILVGIPAEEVRKAKEGLGKTWDAGKITGLDGTRITVQRLDGVAETIGVDENTSFREKDESVTLRDVKPGEGFRAAGHVENGVFTATELHVFNLSGHEPWLDAGHH